MRQFEHPLQLFTLEYPDEWEARYQEETGGLILVYPGLDDACAISLTPMAVTGGERALAEQVAEVAQRLGADIDVEAVETTESDGTRTAYAEGERPAGAEMGGRIRFWVVRHGPLALHIAQIGPGAALEETRRIADALLAGLTFPEIMPPTPEEFRRRVVEVVEREYPEVRAAPEGEWMIRLTDEEGQPVSLLGLENLYRSSLLNAESAGALIREYLDHVLVSAASPPEHEQYNQVRERLMPALKSEDWARDAAQGAELARVEFAPGLILCFAIDEPERMAYVTHDMLARWNIPLERLQEVALDNLAARSESVEMMVLSDGEGRPCAVVVNTRDGYDASRLALPTMRDGFAEVLGDEYLVGIPNRDFLIAFSERDPEIAEGIIRQVEVDYNRMDHPISPAIYRVRADSIERA